MNQRSGLFKKVVIALIIVIIMNFTFAYKSNAAAVARKFGQSLLVKPICYVIIGVTDAVNLLSSVFFLDKEKDNDPTDTWSKAAEEFKEGEFDQWFFAILMSPDKIFSGEVSLLNANIFAAKDTKEDGFRGLRDLWNDIQKGVGGSLAPALKISVSGIYIALRDTAALILLCLLIYTGIRVLLASASPYKQAEWKKYLIDWVKALCLLMFIHLIMIGVFYISDALVDTLKCSFGEYSITAQIRQAFDNTSLLDSAGIIIITIMYLYITYLTAVFFISYFKRLVWIVMLIVISPIVAVTYAIGKPTIFNKWFKEFLSAVLIQPFHMLIFFVLVGLPLGTTGLAKNTTFVEKLVNNVNPLNASSVMIYLYMLLAISMIRPAEKFFMGLFDINGQVAKQGTIESGVKTIKKVEKVVEEGVKLAKDIGMMAEGIPPTDFLGSGGPGSGGLGIPGSDAPGSDGLGIPGSENPGEAGLPGEDMMGLSEEESIANDRTALDSFNEEAADPNNGWDVEQYQALAELNLEQSEREKAFNTDNSENDMSELKEAAEETKEAAKETKEAAEETKEAAAALADGEMNVSDVEFDEALDDIKVEEKPDKPNKLRERLEERHPKLYAAGERFIGAGHRLEEKGMETAKTAVNTVRSSPELQERLNELRKAGNDLRDTMYLDGAPQDWKEGYLGYDSAKVKIDETKKNSLNSYVNNKNNIDYMMNAHGLEKDEAKERLKEAEPFINRGITDIGAVDKLIDQQRLGKDPKAAIKAVSENVKMQAQIREQTNNVINDKSNISAMAQIISRQTGEKADSPKVIEQAKSTMSEARPYIEKGARDPEVLHRLVQLESGLKSAKVGPNGRTPEKVMRMDRKLDKAMKDGLSKVKLKSTQENSQGMKRIESAMNKELGRRQTQAKK